MKLIKLHTILTSTLLASLMSLYTTISSAQVVTTPTNGLEGNKSGIIADKFKDISTKDQGAANLSFYTSTYPYSLGHELPKFFINGSSSTKQLFYFSDYSTYGILLQGTSIPNKTYIDGFGTSLQASTPEQNSLYLNGYFGIGVNEPAERLHMVGNIKFKDKGEIKSYDNNHRIIFDREHDKLEFMEYGDILFSSGAVKGYRTEKMTLSANGNLGIGVTSPVERLELYGNGFIRGKLRLKPAAGEVGITSNHIGGEKAMELTTTDGQELQATRLILNGSKDSSDIQFYTGGRGKESLTMHLEGTSGNLGIGVSAPTERLDVHGNGYIRGRLRLKPAAGEVGITSNQVAGDQAMELTTTDSQGLQATRLILRGSKDDPNIEFYTGGREHEGITMQLDGATGNLGLATSTPRDKLDVNGNTRTRGLIINPTSNNYGLVNGTVATINGVMQISPRDAAPATFNTAEYAKNFLLWVEKGIVTEDLAMVNVKSWSDFVFSPGYELNSIQKVASYIKDHGHLPEIPSEEQIKTEGYSIHGMNRKFLQKIEELTLYIIDQEEKINTQQSRLESLALRMDELEKDKK